MGKKKGKKGSKDADGGDSTASSQDTSRPGTSTQSQHQSQDVPPQRAKKDQQKHQERGQSPQQQLQPEMPSQQQRIPLQPKQIPVPGQYQPRWGPRAKQQVEPPPGLSPQLGPQAMMQQQRPRTVTPQQPQMLPQQYQMPPQQYQMPPQQPQMSPQPQIPTQQPQMQRAPQQQAQGEQSGQQIKGKRGPKQKQQQQQRVEQQLQPRQQQSEPLQQEPHPRQQQSQPRQEQSQPRQQQSQPRQQQSQPRQQQQPQARQQDPQTTQQDPQTRQQDPQTRQQPSQPRREVQTRPADRQPQTRRGEGDRGTPSREPPSKELSSMKIAEHLEVRPLIKATPGTVGRRIPIEVNHLKLNLGNLQTAIHYDVNIIPDVPKRCLRPVMDKFREAYYPNNYPAFDGRKNLYSTRLLPFGETISGSVNIMVEDRSKEYKVEIKYANTVDLTPLHNLMNSVETPREALQVVDIVLRMPPAARCIPAGRSFFVKPPAIIELGEGMEMYNGFYQSAIRGWKPFLNVDVAHKAFPKSIPVTEVLIQLLDSRYQQFGTRDLERPLDSRQKETFQKFMRQLRVIYQIPNNPSSKRIFRVNGVKDSARDKTFKLDDGRTMTIEQYFATEKRCRLRYPLLPTLWVGSTQREILIPLEFCTVVEGQAVNRKMTENQTSNMIRHAATSTNIRKEKIYKAINEANHNSHPSVREFGFSIANEFEKLEARVLPPPTLEYANKKTINVSKGVWRGERFFQGKQINRWTIAIADRRSPRPDELSNMASMIYRNAAQNGMSITSEATKPYTTMGNNLHEIRKYFQTAKSYEYDIIFVVVPNQGPQYSYVKKAAELNVGCLTQCVKMRTLGRMNPQTVGNILLKVNSKLNGTNHFLSIRPPIMNRPCMIMGADVTHPSPDSQGIPSVAAVTASHDPKAFCYNICWRLQPPKMEIIEDLENITREQLLFFFKKTNVKPERIVFFRDGVSEGQFDQVRDAEIMAIRKACRKLQATDYEPSITFLVVQKRHHTRMFPMNPRDSEDRNNNVPAGTCVDTVITHPFMQDFYLVSHASIQGVAKPTKYCTLWDDNGMTNNDIEQLAYFLCHMFTRCNRSVSYPAPTYYAHLAAARAKVYIENERLNMNDLKRENDNYKILDEIRKDMPMFFV